MDITAGTQCGCSQDYHYLYNQQVMVKSRREQKVGGNWRGGISSLVEAENGKKLPGNFLRLLLLRLLGARSG